MRRLSKRSFDGNQDPIVQFKYITTEAPTQIEYIEKEIVKEVPVETIIVQRETEAVDMKPIYDKLFDIESQLMVNAHINKEFREKAATELEMQRRALVGLKAQRDIDRNRRLMLINRIKKEQKARKATDLKLKLAIIASLMISIISLVVKF